MEEKAGKRLAAEEMPGDSAAVVAGYKEARLRSADCLAPCIDRAGRDWRYRSSFLSDRRAGQHAAPAGFEARSDSSFGKRIDRQPVYR